MAKDFYTIYLHCPLCGSADMNYGTFDYYIQKQLYCGGCGTFYVFVNNGSYQWKKVEDRKELDW